MTERLRLDRDQRAIVGQGASVILVRETSTVRWDPSALWSILAEGTDLPRTRTSWSSRVAPGPDGTLHHHQFALGELVRHYEFEVIGATGQRCFAEAITVRPHPDGSFIELSGEAPSDEVARWLHDSFAVTLRSLAALADDHDDL